MDAKTYTIAGTSYAPNADGTQGDIKSFRFSNSALNLRVNMLHHKGHVDVNLVELPRPMTQVRAIAWLLENVKGCKNAVIATRAADKTVKSDVVIKAQELVAKSRARAAAKAEKVALAA